MKPVSYILALCLFIMAQVAHAQVNAFTEHQIISMWQHGVYSDRFPTGQSPYLGRTGIEYQTERVSYSLAYIHRSNADISGRDEYNYNGIAVGIKFTRCILLCD